MERMGYICFISMKKKNSGFFLKRKTIIMKREKDVFEIEH